MLAGGSSGSLTRNASNPNGSGIFGGSSTFLGGNLVIVYPSLSKASREGVAGVAEVGMGVSTSVRATFVSACFSPPWTKSMGEGGVPPSRAF